MVIDLSIDLVVSLVVAEFAIAQIPERDDRPHPAQPGAHPTDQLQQLGQGSLILRDGGLGMVNRGDGGDDANGSLAERLDAQLQLGIGELPDLAPEILDEFQDPPVFFTGGWKGI